MTRRTDPFDVAKHAAAVIAERTGSHRHDVALVLGSGWGQAGDLHRRDRRDGGQRRRPRLPRRRRRRAHSRTMRSVAIGDTGRRALVYGTRTHFYEGRGVRRRRPRRPHRPCGRVLDDRPHQRLRRPQPSLGARHAGPHPRPHQPHGGSHRSRARTSSTSPTSTRPRLRDDRARGRPHARRGRLRPVPRAALRDAGRGADGQAHRRRPRRHVDGARGDRGSAGGSRGARHLARHQPGRRHLRRAAQPRGGPRGRPGRRRPVRRPARRRRAGASDDRDRRLADLLAAARAWRDDDPDRDDRGASSTRLIGRARGRLGPGRGTSWPTASPACSSSAPPGCVALSAPVPTG